MIGLAAMLPALETARIVVIARPAVGRQIVQSLVGSGYEVFRTPSALDLASLVDRIRPHLAIIAVDLIGCDGIEAALEIQSQTSGGQILLFGEADGDRRASELPIVSSIGSARAFQSTVQNMLRLTRPNS